ncbi:uncharacterized protein [Diabrotica undecimpunctata]|uniref:uncharacterized protein n=1 Tax=Diabrotica undecimpunctata TaxID=50387 RepID=UPI003B638423
MKRAFRQSPVGKRDVAKAVAAEQGQIITAVCCMTATSHHVPPCFLFARKRMTLFLIKDGPTACNMAITESGYMNTLTFINYLEHFKKHASLTEENPVLLISDNHVSHTNLQAVTFAKDNSIHLLSLPTHSSYKTHPLDQAFKPLKAYSLKV